VKDAFDNLLSLYLPAVFEWFCNPAHARRIAIASVGNCRATISTNRHALEFRYGIVFLFGI